jgi:hypothetical protein
MPPNLFVLKRLLREATRLQGTKNIRTLEGVAPTKLPATHCLNPFLPDWLETEFQKSGISLTAP